jgi:uncharacterized damage-inducible protein DinB
MDPRLLPLAEIFRLNTRLLHNCLDGLTEEQARARPTAATNSAAFVAAHVADTRFAIVGWLGGTVENPLAADLAGARGIEDLPSLPPLDTIRAAWDAASAALALHLATVAPEALDGPSPQRFPGAGPTLLGALAFLAQHDSYHVGQLALLRKYAGLPAMRYGEARSRAG